MGTVISRIGNIDEAEDIVQDIFKQLVKNSDKLAELAADGNLTMYCYNLTRNMIMHSWRRFERSTPLLNSVDDEWEAGSQVAEDSHDPETIIALKEAINSLGKVEKEIIIMLMNGYKIMEISEKLGITPKQVALYQSRALKKLQKQIVPD